MPHTPLYKQAQNALATFVHKQDKIDEIKQQEDLAQAQSLIKERIYPEVLKAVNQGKSKVKVKFDLNACGRDVAEAVRNLLVRVEGFPEESVETPSDACFMLTITLGGQRAEKQPDTPPDPELASRYNTLLGREDVKKIIAEMASLYQRFNKMKQYVEVKVPTLVAAHFADDPQAWQAFAQAAGHRLGSAPANLTFDSELGLITFVFPQA